MCSITVLSHTFEKKKGQRYHVDYLTPIGSVSTETIEHIDTECSLIADLFPPNTKVKFAANICYKEQFCWPQTIGNPHEKEDELPQSA